MARTSTASTSGGSAAVARAVRPTRSVTTAARATPVSAPAIRPATATDAARSRTIRRNSDGEAPCASRSKSSPRSSRRSPTTVNRIPASASRRATPAATASAIRVPWAIGSRLASASSARRDSIASTWKGFAARAWSTAVASFGSRKPSQTSFTRAAPGPREVDGRRQCGAVADDRLALDTRESPHRPDDAYRTRSPPICSGSRPLGSAAAASVVSRAPGPVSRSTAAAGGSASRPCS